MANKKHLAILEQGLLAWNKWRQEEPDVLPDLSGADLCGEDYSTRSTASGTVGINFDKTNLSRSKLRDVFFSEASMMFTDFRGADLCGAQICSCNLIGADLSAASCGGTYFGFCLLRGSKLRHTWFESTNLTDAKLDGADFDGAILEGTIFGDNDLSHARNLDLARHNAPSMVGIATIYRSKGRIPESFLRGCGVPENLISYIPSLVDSEEGFQFYSCFISYSSIDEEFARRLHGRMRDARLRVWFAPEDIQGGKKLHEQIETAIRLYDKLLIVLSEASMQSEWVMTEIRKARRHELRTGKRKLFPVRLVDMETMRDWECFDADSGKDLAVELREYFIPDFSHWKDHDSFETAFTRLLKDLRADEV